MPTAGKPLFQAAAANLNPWTEAKVDTKNPERGPLLIISSEMDHTVPPAVVKAAYKQQQDNEGVTEFVEIKNRGHGLTIDSGWREVTETALPSSNASHNALASQLPVPRLGSPNPGKGTPPRAAPGLSTIRGASAPAAVDFGTTDLGFRPPSSIAIESIVDAVFAAQAPVWPSSRRREW